MKWLPISELSDKQKDGKYYLFLYGDFSGTFSCRFDKDTEEWISISGDILYCWAIHDEETYFLPEPIPDLPKPEEKKFMEWIRFEDGTPYEGEKCLFYIGKDFNGEPIIKDGIFFTPMSNVKCFLGHEAILNSLIKAWATIVPPEDL